MISQLHLDKYLGLGKKVFTGTSKEKVETLTRPERIRLVLEELGPTFIKFGQLLSNRPDLVPAQYLFELEKLQDKVPPFSSEKAIEMVEKELGKPLKYIFKNFEREPLASGSIAQVHKAVLLSGIDVGVKIQRPHIRNKVETDLEIMHQLAVLIEKYNEEAALFQPVKMVREFERNIKKEMNFRLEASHMERFASNFKDDKRIYVPRAYREFSTDRILTMEYIKGIKVSEVEKLKKEGMDIKTLADNGANIILKQVFEHGFFHADPHPGNLVVLPDQRLCLLDFGMMGIVLPRHQDYLGTIILGIVQNDARKITRAVLALTGQDAYLDTDRLEYETFNLIKEYAYLPLQDINVGEIFQSLMDLIFTFRLSLPPDMYLLFKALVASDGVGRKLHPDFDMIGHIEPFAKKLLKKRFSPARLLKEWGDTGVDFTHLLRDMPGELREVMQLVKRGRVRFEFIHKNLEPLMHKNDQISNRVAYSIVLASLIIGSSLIVLSQVPPTWRGIPVIGLGGFITAAFMGFWLLLSIIRHGKM